MYSAPRRKKCIYIYIFFAQNYMRREKKIFKKSHRFKQYFCIAHLVAIFENSQFGYFVEKAALFVADC